MLLDPTNQFIRNISQAFDLNNTLLLELGCGTGRITRDLASRARAVVAVDPDANALRRARSLVFQSNVTFIQAGAEALDIAGDSFDAAIFSLSLHHVPREAMDRSLQKAAARISPNGRIVVIEPGDDGTLIEAEMAFDVGDGDERSPKSAAQDALLRLAGWRVSKTVTFRTLFHFNDLGDFLEYLPSRHERTEPFTALQEFLEAHRRGAIIELWAERRMSVLMPELG